MAYELRQQGLRLAEQERDPVYLAYAHYGLGSSLFWRGDVMSAHRHWEEALALADTEQVAPPAFFAVQNPWVDTRARGTWCLWLLGFPDQALQRFEEALRLAEQISYPLTKVMTLFCAARLHQFRRDGGVTRRYADTITSLSTAHGFPHYVAQGTMLQGWSRVEEGSREAGIAQMSQGLAAYRATGATLGGPYLLSLQAEAYGKARRPEEGLALLEEAFELTQKYGERWWEAELYRLQGELRGMQPSAKAAEVEASFQQSLQVAQTQESKSLELRTAMSLARLWQSQDKHPAAYDLLAPVYGWFTEGFDTADLIEAKGSVLIVEMAPITPPAQKHTD
jgi:predicted ATPase